MTGVLACMVGGASLSASANAYFFVGSNPSTGTATTSPTCSITVSNGSGSYTYAWTKTSGDATTAISSATSATVTWSRNVSGALIYDSFWSCVVTDTVTSATATLPSIQAELQSLS